jgi:hypothetical protein
VTLKEGKTKASHDRADEQNKAAQISFAMIVLGKRKVQLFCLRPGLSHELYVLQLCLICLLKHGEKADGQFQNRQSTYCQ